MSMRWLISRLAATLCLAAVCQGLGAPVDPLDDKALRAAVVPDADLLMTVQGTAWRETPIYAVMDRLWAEAKAAPREGEAVVPVQKELTRSVVNPLEALGVGSEDMVAMVWSARTLGQWGQLYRSDAQQALEQFGLVLAARLAQPLTMVKIRMALGNLAGAQGQELMFEKGSYQGAEILSVVRPEQPGESRRLPQSFLVALVDGGLAVYVGGEAGVKAALDRLAAAQPAPLSATMTTAREAADPAAQTQAFLVLNDQVRTFAATRATQMPEQQALQRTALQGLAGLQYVALGVSGSDKVAMRLGQVFASAEQAAAMTSVVDQFVLAMLKGYLFQAVGQPIPLIQSLSSRQSESSMEVVAEVTEEDLRALYAAHAAGKLAWPPLGGRPGMPLRGRP
ncbi:MAG: hypothetical protein GX595_08810 [Lentisphaerae bacterium]|nr:hypothetical protein [Lentisphaerota bacterium]